MGKSAGLSPLRMRPALTPTWRRASARLVRTDQPARLSISHDRLRTNAIGGIDQYRNPSCARASARARVRASFRQLFDKKMMPVGEAGDKAKLTRCRGPRLPASPAAARLPRTANRSGASAPCQKFGRINCLDELPQSIRMNRSTDNQLRSGRRYRTRRSLCERVNLSNSLEKVFASEVVNTDSSRVRTRSTSGSARSRRSSPAFVKRNK